jgi:hypothetical protein
MEDVNLSSGGTETLYVKFKNPTKYTAFQFDLTLPKGVSVAEIGIGGDVPSTREKEFALINKETNTYRFLSYDMENAKLGENASLKISLLASEDATTGVAETSETLLVDPEGESTNLGTDVASITIVDDSPEIIEFGDGGKLAMVSTKNLDFSNREDVKAYIATGYDQMTSEIWLTRVTDVPAGTPIWVSGPKGEKKEILVGTPVTYYPENLLVGSATEDITVPASDDNFINMTLSPKSGKTAVVQSAITGFAAGKAYLHLPKNVTSLVGSDADVTLNAFGKLAYVSKSDLNFANVEGLKAYIATGYAKDGTIWMTRVMKASVNTPLYLKGDKNGSYTIPAAEAKMVYVNMLKGDANNTSDVKAVDGEFTSCVLSKSTGEFGPIGKDNSAFPAGTAYLPLPTAYMKSATRGNGVFEFSESEAEVICVKLFGDGETTGINKVAGEDVDSEKWYNLNGQRIDAPVRKGLYIRNGKKVIVR